QKAPENRSIFRYKISTAPKSAPCFCFIFQKGFRKVRRGFRRSPVLPLHFARGLRILPAFRKEFLWEFPPLPRLSAVRRFALRHPLSAHLLSSLSAAGALCRPSTHRTRQRQSFHVPQGLSRR